MSLLEDLVKQAAALTPDEKLRLLAYLAENMRQTHQGSESRRQWHEIKGTAPYPLFGEDAQSWISRTRHEGDLHREKQ